MARYTYTYKVREEDKEREGNCSICNRHLTLIGKDTTCRICIHLISPRDEERKLGLRILDLVNEEYRPRTRKEHESWENMIRNQKIYERKKLERKRKKQLEENPKKKKETKYTILEQKYREAINIINKKSLIASVRSRIATLLRKKTDLDKKHKEIGCSANELKAHLESKFYDRADGTKMTWENKGVAGWHIDHVKPVSKFDEANIHMCNHYSNLQPLWAEDNARKGSKEKWITETIVEHSNCN